MPKRNLRILVLTTYEGHLSIGEAIADYINKQPGYEAALKVQDLPMRMAYTTLYQFFPSTSGPLFALSTHELLVKSSRILFRSRSDEFVNAAINEYQPDLIISAFYFYIPSLEDACAKNGIPFINILTDPLTVHPVTAAAAPIVNCGFDKKTVRAVKKFEQPSVVSPIGWFVRDRFEQDYDQKRVRKSLKLDLDKLTILVASGSEGTNLVMKILPVLLLSDKPTQVVVACGANKGLKQVLEQFAKVLASLGNKNELVIVGFTKHIEKYMQAADLVVGKAGPNSLFESVATKTPFFAITHISGQEDGNLDIIKSYKLGYVEENAVKLVSLLKSIIDDPGQLSRFKSPLAKLAKYNQMSKSKLKALIEQTLAVQ